MPGWLWVVLGLLALGIAFSIGMGIATMKWNNEEPPSEEDGSS